MTRLRARLRAILDRRVAALPSRRRHMTVRTEDRLHDGTKSEREQHIPLGVRVRYFIAIAVSLLAAYGAWQAKSDNTRQHHDERQTCIIQARGLPAGHQLAASMTDIYQLLTLTPTSAAQRLAARNEPPSVQKLVRQLDTHLAAYLRAEGLQPQSRSCN